MTCLAGIVLMVLAGSGLLAQSMEVASSDCIEVQVSSEPSLPVANLLPASYNSDFEQGLKGWVVPKLTPRQLKLKESQRPRVSVVSDPQKGGKSLRLENNGASVYRICPVSLLKKGQSYIGSCMIRPGLQVSTAGAAHAGLGFSLTYWDRSYRQASGLVSAGGGAEQWKKLVSKPFVMPEYAHTGQLTVCMRYSPGVGLLDDLQIFPAYAQLTVSVKSKESAVRQVKVMDDSQRTVFDTGVLQEQRKAYRHTFQVETPYVYTVLVITADGDVKSVCYPQQ